MVELYVIILAHLSHEELFFLFLFFQKLMVVILIVIVLFLVLDWELVIHHVFSISLPCWVVDIWVHKFSFLHFLDNIINLVFIQQFINHLLMLGYVPVHEVQAPCQDLHLIHDLLEFKRHHLWNNLNLSNNYIVLAVLLLWDLLDRIFAEISRVLLFGQLVWFKQRLNSIPIDFLLEVVLHNSSLSIHVFVKIRHPNHHQLILCPCRKVISFLIKLNCLNLSFMAQYCPSKPSLFQVPNFNFAIVRNWWHVVSVRMECQSVNCSIMSVIVLDQLAQSCIPQFDCAVNGWCCDACSIWSEFATQNFAFVLCKVCCYHCFVYVPKLDTSIVWAWENQPFIVRNFAFSYPVGMTQKRLLELSVHAPHFDCLVRRARNYKILLLRKGDFENGARVCFYGFIFSVAE